MHHLSSNNSANPALGPLFSVPAIGWAGIKISSLLKRGIISLIVYSFAEPTSEIIVPFDMWGIIFFIIFE